jgi:deoxycytidylate deaminase
MGKHINNEILNRLSALAKKSVLTHKHGAVIIDNHNAIVSEGINHMSSSMLQDHSIHAEIDALCKLRSRHRRMMHECTMFVVRIGPPSKDFAFKMSKPCKNCSDAIIKSGIKRVFYST